MTSEETEEPSKNKKRLIAFRDLLFNHIPIIDWFPKYKWKEYIVHDLTAGVTIGCLQIPQGMAFAMLANVEPIMGLYTSCFPVLIYCVLGSATISSYGAVSVTSLLVGEAIENAHSMGHSGEHLSEVITFLVGIVYLIAFCIRYHVIIKVFTKYLTSAFVSACSIQVITKSFKLLLGVETDELQGNFSFIFNAYRTFAAVPDTNFYTLGISLSILTLLAINTYVIIPNMKKVTKIVLPVEILILVTVTALSYYFEFQRFDIAVLGTVPSGFPVFSFPQVEAAEWIWHDSLVVASINLATTLSVLLMFNENLRVSQEILAMAVANIVCSNLHTIPFGNSMMRTVVAQICGVKTLLASVFSSIIVLMALLFMGPLFSPMPHCVLGCIVVYGMTMLLVTKCKELPDMFRGGVENALIWVTTIVVTLFISIELGLLAGLILTVRQFLSNPDWETKKKEEEEAKAGNPQPGAGNVKQENRK